MKKLIFAFLFLVSIPLMADQSIINDLSGGMWSFPSSNKIPDNSAAFIQNFWTDIEPIAVERNGYEKKDTTQLGNPNAVSGLWEFLDSSGNQWIISFSSRTFYRNLITVTPVAFGLVQTVDTVPDCAVNLGKIWCVNGTDDLWWFDGTSTGNVSGAPIGRIIEPWRNRIVIADISSNRSSLHFSADGDGTDWTVGGNPTDPFILTIGGANDGFVIKCLNGSFNDNLIVGRQKDTYGITGFDQADIINRKISSEVGCIENETMREVDNSLVWLSNRGVEEMRGLTIRSISDPVRDITDELVKNTVDERSNTQTSADDWNAGTLGPNVYADTTTASGTIQLDYPDEFNTYRDGSVGTKKVWVDYQVGTYTGSQGTANGVLALINNVGSELGRGHVRTVKPTTDFRRGTTIQMQLTQFGSDLTANDDFYISITTDPTITNHPSSLTTMWEFNFQSTTSARYYLVQISTNDGQVISQSTTIDSADASIGSDISIYISTDQYQVALGDVVATSGDHNWAPNSNDLYVYMSYKKGGTGSGTLGIGKFSVSPQTCTFTSQTMSVGSNITSWGIFNETDSGSTITYLFNSTSSASIGDFNEADWSSISNGGVPSNSTFTYAAVRALIQTSTWSAVPKLNDFTIRWNEGATPSAIAWNFDRRYWLAYTTNPAASPTNDNILVYQRTKSWTTLGGINATSFATWRDKLYFGDATANGYVFQFDVGNSDDGSDILSTIYTKSFDMNAPHRPKEFKTAWGNYLANAGSSGSFSLDYFMNRDRSISFSMGSADMNETVGQNSAKFPFASADLSEGREIQYFLKKVGTGGRFKLDSIITEFTPKEPE